jgi:hypothetical protein
MANGNGIAKPPATKVLADTPPKSGSGPKNILFISFEACAGDLAYRLKQEGCNIKWYVQSKADRVLYDGFLDKVDEWEPHKDWADLIIIDDIGFGALADRLRKEGKAVVGGSAYTDRLELDRDFGAQEMKAAGLTIPDSWEFGSFEDALKFVPATSSSLPAKRRTIKSCLLWAAKKTAKTCLPSSSATKKDGGPKSKAFRSRSTSPGSRWPWAATSTARIS